MNILDEDLDDSTLFCKSLVQKRKAVGNGNPKSSKQLKLQFSQLSSQSNKDSQTVRNDNLSEEKPKSTNQDFNSKLDESKSSYFSVTKSANTCPLCLKAFKSDSAYSGHMKSCAKTHKMTTQQLLGALELQKKQMQERRTLGLCSQKPVSPAKTISKKKKEKHAEQYDLALGLALSKSLSTAEGKNVTVSEMQRSTTSQTLEEFGFTSQNAVVGTSRRKNDVDKKPTSVLRERTVEDRQRIIIEKVAVILLDENQETSSKNKNWDYDLEIQNGQVPLLWNMGENNGKLCWYVDGIKSLILTEEENPNQTTQSSNSEDDNNIENEISKLNLPRRDIHKDWNKMINNSKLSDVTAKTKDCRDVHLHSLVLFARCPEILEKDCGFVFQKFNLSTILIFLEFVYCGTVNGLIRTEIDNLLDLAVEFNYDELITVLNCLKSNLAGDGCDRNSNSPPKAEVVETEVKHPETDGKESKNATILEDRDLFTEDGLVDLTQNSHKSNSEDDENESNAEKSYWSFIHHEKKKSEEIEKSVDGEANGLDEEETNSKNAASSDKQLQRFLSGDSTTRDLDYEFKKSDNILSSDCIILSSGSDSKTQENLVKPTTSRTPSPVKVDYEVPEFDPYDNFHFFSEEQFSPVGVHSQSLISGDISMESLKSSEVGKENPEQLDDFQQEPKKTFGYCSTPVAVHPPSKVKSTNSVERSKKRKIRDPSSSRILRKSLGLQHKRRISKSNSAKRTNLKKKETRRERELTEALTNSILHELSKSSAFQSSPLSERKMFVEMTPISSRDEFVDNVTPSPNFSNMGESVIKEQLTKYGLKKNLARSKAKKILRYIYEELHPLYNTETGKIVKKLPGNTPKPGKKSKPKAKQTKGTAVGKSKQERKQKNHHNSSRESEEMSFGSDDRLSDYGSDESEFEYLSETLTQSTPCNPVDLTSAFFDFLQLNPDYHQKILLYEPIWLEDLQRKLKEAFKKHFKIADLMDFLDKKCVTFRSEAQAKTNQKRNEKKKGNLKKKKNSS